MIKKNRIGALVLAVTFLAFGNAYAQEPIEYKQLMAKCSEAIKQVRSYNIKVEMSNSSIINSQTNTNNSARLNIAFVSPDKFKVEQIIDEGTGDNLWDGWIVTGDDYYEFRINPPTPGQDLKDYKPTSSWAKGDSDGRKVMSKNNSPEGIIKQLEDIDAKYKRGPILSATENGVECFVIKYSIGKGSVDLKDLPPELKNAEVKGSSEVWINKNTYLPMKQTEEISYYSDEKNNASSSFNLTYSSYNDDKIKIDAPKLGSQVF